MSDSRTKSICFVTGTRADFGKLKSLISAASNHYDVRLFITGMHLLSKYGSTWIDVERSFKLPTHKYINQREGDALEVVLSKTIAGFSDYLHEEKPDLVIVHGDRVEALACSMAACFSGVLVGHVEGGEVSGTVDEIIRHAVSKVSHAHFVSNEEAERRLRQLGELPKSIFIMGSPDLDVMAAQNLPTLDFVKTKYDIPFDDYGLCMFHPVVTELDRVRQQANTLTDALIASERNFIVISPNNDPGNEHIFEAYERFAGNPRFVHRPSVRFEAFLTLLKHAKAMLGNSSAGVRETSFYGISSLDIGTRQRGRARAASITHIESPSAQEIVAALDSIWGVKHPIETEFGDGKSDERFLDALLRGGVWELSHQKRFVDLISR